MKKTMKKLAAGVLALTMALSMTACSSYTTLDQIRKDGKIVMGTNAAFPPFEYMEGETIVGVDAEIAAEIAKDLGVELEIKNMEFDSIIPSVTTGKVAFGAAGMTVREDRLKNVDFSTKYVKSSQYIILPEDSDITSPDQLEGKRIGVQAGTTGDMYATEEIEGATVNPYKNALDAAMDLNTGKLDAVIIDKLPAETIVKQNAGLKLVNEPLTEEEYAICVGKGNKELLEAINGTLQRLMDEGKIDSYLAKHNSAQ
ncbi:transporter substrate-binding domain-containing protein [Candidatus Soleaferrea massiliensis]|uniref:transporter substrate-binding domain-containing protein n=1 Tax=Candidatus Soleaferrea massiliensis TaxID=1470354 RepID=UPI000590ACE9|nr:transporter substrate-binding domain-containing protein [Candidatus Soleaferrea massiliensis]